MMRSDVTANATDAIPGLVSVVTASYNMGRYIGETLASVLGQDYPHVESIVVDDGSTDDTPEILDSYVGDERVRVIRQANAGQTVAKNRGIAAARGEYVAFCDADDIWEPSKLSRQIPRFLGDPAVGVVFSEISFMDAAGKPLTCSRMRRFEGRVTAHLLIDNFVPFPTAVVRADVIRQMNAFDESLSMSIDYDLWLRISTKYRFAYVPEPLARYRIWEGQMSRRLGERLDNFQRLLVRFQAENPGAATPREIARAHAHFHVTRGSWHAEEGRVSAAWEDYRTALRLDPVSARMWRKIAALATGRVTRTGGGLA